MAVFTNVKRRDVENLKGYSKEKTKTIYEELRLKNKDVTLILYISGKLLLQGKKEAVAIVAEQLEKKGLGERVKSETFRKEKGWVIGSDEALKGDTFGGLIIAAVKADDQLREQLLQIGVADSKSLSDKEVLNMAEKIRKAVPCEVKSILPEEYNQNGKITVMLNQFHKQCAGYLKPGKHIVDKYPGCTVGDVAVEKAEVKYLEVAAASVLARAAALKQLDFLSMRAGFSVPKGSTHVKLALMELKERRRDFTKFVKVDFANVREFL